MVANEVCHTPIATSLAIILFVNKSFLFLHLFNKDAEGPVEFLKGEKINQMLLKFVPLCSLGICNLIASLKHRLDNPNPLDCILGLKAMSGYNYINDNCFLGQLVGQKIYLFKMSINGVAFEFDFVQ
jgi:hypothetical protein